MEEEKNTGDVPEEEKVECENCAEAGESHSKMPEDKEEE